MGKPKTKITPEDQSPFERRTRREAFVEEGAYDARLRPQRHKDKKKEADRRKCRKKVDVPE